MVSLSQALDPRAVTASAASGSVAAAIDARQQVRGACGYGRDLSAERRSGWSAVLVSVYVGGWVHGAEWSGRTL